MPDFENLALIVVIALVAVFYALPRVREWARIGFSQNLSELLDLLKVAKDAGIQDEVSCGWHGWRRRFALAPVPLYEGGWTWLMPYWETRFTYRPGFASRPDDYVVRTRVDPDGDGGEGPAETFVDTLKRVVGARFGAEPIVEFSSPGFAVCCGFIKTRPDGHVVRVGDVIRNKHDPSRLLRVSGFRLVSLNGSVDVLTSAAITSNGSILNCAPGYVREDEVEPVYGYPDTVLHAVPAERT